MKTTGAQVLADMLAGYGVTHVFMVPAVLRRTFAEMERRTQISRIHCHGEKAAAYMADGYARASGKPGICMAQVVGALNLAARLCAIAKPGQMLASDYAAHLAGRLAGVLLVDRRPPLGLRQARVARGCESTQRGEKPLGWLDGGTAPVDLHFRGPFADRLKTRRELRVGHPRRSAPTRAGANSDRYQRDRAQRKELLSWCQTHGPSVVVHYVVQGVESISRHNNGVCAPTSSAHFFARAGFAEPERSPNYELRGHGTYLDCWLALHDVDDRVARVEVEAGGGEECGANVSREQ